MKYDDIEDLAAEIPTSQSHSVVQVLVEANVATSNGEARRLIQGGAISVNGVRITEDAAVEPRSLIKKGKNNFVLVR